MKNKISRRMVVVLALALVPGLFVTAAYALNYDLDGIPCTKDLYDAATDADTEWAYASGRKNTAKMNEPVPMYSTQWWDWFDNDWIPEHQDCNKWETARFALDYECEYEDTCAACETCADAQGALCWGEYDDADDAMIMAQIWLASCLAATPPASDSVIEDAKKDLAEKKGIRDGWGHAAVAFDCAAVSCP